MTPKEDIINFLIKENSYTSYLEIGYQHGYNFSKIKCTNKISVDLNGKADYNNGSDSFFEQNNKTFQCIFIDGSHYSDQVEKDAINASKCLSKNGVIIFHDTCPNDENMTIVPRQQKIWTGDVYKTVIGLIKKYPDVKKETYISDWGVTIVYPEGRVFEEGFIDEEITFKEFFDNKYKILNIIGK